MKLSTPRLALTALPLVFALAGCGGTMARRDGGDGTDPDAASSADVIVTTDGAPGADAQPDATPTDCGADLTRCEYLGRRLPVIARELAPFTDPMTGREIPLFVHAPMGRGPYPVVIWSHGGSFNATGHHTNDAWGEAIAADGYIVVHPAHVPPTAETAMRLCAIAAVPAAECVPPSAADGEDGLFITVARPRDVIALIDYLPTLAAMSAAANGPMMDTSRVVVAGWSGGSRAPMALLGAVRHLTPSITHFGMPSAVPLAGIGLSPAGPGFSGFFSEGADHSWLGMRGPMFVLTGVNDVKPDLPELTGPIRRTAYDLEPADGTRRILYSHLPVGTGGHGTYNLGDLGSANPDLARASRAIRASVLAFLDSVAYRDADAAAYLASDRPLRLAGDAEWSTR